MKHTELENCTISYDGSDSHCPSFLDELETVPVWALRLDTWADLKKAAEARLCSAHARRPLSIHCDGVAWTDLDCAEARALLSCDEFMDACADGHCECADLNYESDIECALDMVIDTMRGAELWAVSGTKEDADPIYVPGLGHFDLLGFRYSIESLCKCECSDFCSFSLTVEGDTRVIYRHGYNEVVLAAVSSQVEEAVHLLSGGWHENAHNSEGVESWVELLLSLETCQVERLAEVARLLDLDSDFFTDSADCEAFIKRVIEASADAVEMALRLVTDSEDFLDVLQGAELLAA